MDRDSSDFYAIMSIEQGVTFRMLDRKDYLLGTNVVVVNVVIFKLFVNTKEDNFLDKLLKCAIS